MIHANYPKLVHLTLLRNSVTEAITVKLITQAISTTDRRMHHAAKKGPT
uniref:Uncharacterized protein n=1 Tax=Arundo donax TaxID=35708 RepID=A0A0A9HGJ3_ARUDO